MNRSSDPPPENCTPTRDSIHAAPTDFSDEQLLEQFKAGQPHAGGELLCRHQAAAYRVAYGLLGNRDDALDTVQEGFAKAFARLHRFEGRSSFKTWLLRIVRNTALNLGRQATRSRNLRKRAAPAQLTEWTRTPADELIGQELLDVIRQILEGCVNERRQRVFAMWDLGLPFDLIAEEVSVSEETIRQDLQRVRKVLRQELPRRGWSTP